MIGILGDSCDLDRDGELNAAERALECMIIDDFMREDDECDDFDDDDF